MRGLKRGRMKKKGRIVLTLPLHRPPASALGSLPSVALSSGRAENILPWRSKNGIMVLWVVLERRDQETGKQEVRQHRRQID
jgi:hypothetical protein